MPQPFQNAIITDDGAGLLTRAQAGEIKIEFTRVGIGDGIYMEEEKGVSALQAMIALKSEKNSYPISDISIHTGHSVKITALITNQDPVTKEVLVDSGYFINEMGLFARVKDGGDDTEILYSIAVTAGENGDFMPPYNGYNPAQIIQEYYATVNNSAEVTIQSNLGAPALADDLMKLKEEKADKDELPTKASDIGAVSTEYAGQHFVADYVSKSGKEINKAGWYRIAENPKGHDGNSCVISLKRSYNIGAPEFQKIQFMTSYTSKKFVPLAAYTGQYGEHMWTKIRHVRETDPTGQTSQEKLGEYIEVYYDGEGKSNSWLITVEDALGVYSNPWKAVAPVLTEESAPNTQVLATLDLPANFDMGHLMNKTGDTIKNAAFRFEGDYMFKFMPGVVGSGFARGALYCNRNGDEIGGIGMFGTGDTYSAAYMAVGSAAPWSSNAGLYVTADDIKWKNQRLVTQNSNTVGSGATAIGDQCAAFGYKANAGANSSVAFGSNVSSAGGFSTAVGVNTSAPGIYSTAIGYNALASVQNSLAVGHNVFATVNGAVAIGYQIQTNGSYSVAIGYSAAATNAYSVSIGRNTYAYGEWSVAIGPNAAVIQERSVAIGKDARANAPYSLALGENAYVSGNGSTAVGHNARATDNNGIQLGDPNNLSSLTCRVSLTTTSDERDKTDIEEMGCGALDFLNRIHAIRYVLNHRELYIDEKNLSEGDRKKKDKFGICAYDREAHAAGGKKGSRRRVGLSAQEVQAALLEVFGSPSYLDLVNDNLFDFDPKEVPEDVESRLSMNYTGFIPVIIKALQELSGKVDQLTEVSE